MTPSPLSMMIPVSVRSPTCRDVHEAARASTACAGEGPSARGLFRGVCAPFSGSGRKVLLAKHARMILSLPRAPPSPQNSSPRLDQEHAKSVHSNWGAHV